MNTVVGPSYAVYYGSENGLSKAYIATSVPEYHLLLAPNSFKTINISLFLKVIIRYISVSPYFNSEMRDIGRCWSSSFLVALRV